MNPNLSWPPSAWRVACAFASIYVAWGTTYKAMSVGVRDEHLPPLLFGGLRVAGAGAVLLLWLVWRRESIRVPHPEIPWLGLTGAILFVGGNGLITLGLRTVPSGMSSVIAASSPLWMACFSLLLPHGDRLTLRGWGGLLVGIAGVFVLLSDSRQASTVPTETVAAWDVGLCFASACSWGIGSLFVRHLRLRTGRMAAASYQMLCGGIAQILLGLVLGEAKNIPVEVTWRAPAAFFYLLLVGSLWGFMAYSWLLSHVSAARAGTYAYVNPAIAILIGWASGETVTGGLAAGLLAILLAVFLVRSGEKPPGAGPADESEHQPA